MDTEIEVTKDGNTVTARVTKQRDRGGGAVFTGTLRTVEIGAEADGSPATSCVVVHQAPPGGRSSAETVNDQIEQARALARTGQYRADPRSPEWLGRALAPILSLDADTDLDQVKTAIKNMIRSCALKVADRFDEHRKPRKFIIPGDAE